MNTTRVIWPLALALGVAAAPAAAQDTAAAATQDSATGAAPVAPAAAPICTDRPTKANLACTVPVGDLQIETDIVNWTRSSAGDTQTDVVLYTNPTAKLGLGTHTDLEFNLAPYETVRTRVGDDHETLGGVGDLYIRLKQNFSASDSKIQVALIPYVKAPTARVGIGNGEWEGGLIAPVVFTLPHNFTLNIGPEVDILADASGTGDHHAQAVGVVNLSKTVGKATYYAEFWSAQNFDPAGTTHQYSADVAVAYLITPVWQIDLGGNFGLNRETPDAQVYLGLSTRF